ncbi:MAG: zinc-ribbon domain-containing protein [Candidatus Lutacidiplasmatales archaeon]
MGASFCPRCGTTLTVSAQFCAKCGSPVPPIGPSQTPQQPSSPPNVASPSLGWTKRSKILIGIGVVAAGIGSWFTYDGANYAQYWRHNQAADCPSICPSAQESLNISQGIASGQQEEVLGLVILLVGIALVVLGVYWRNRRR